jgi:hypothetical protein
MLNLEDVALVISFRSVAAHINRDFRVICPVNLRGIRLKQPQIMRDETGSWHALTLLNWQFFHLVNETANAFLSGQSIILGLNFIDTDVIIGFSAPNLNFEASESQRRGGLDNVNDGIC